MDAEVKRRPADGHDPRPRSAVGTMVGLVGLGGLLAWTAISRAYGMEGPLAALVALLACGVPMLLWALLVDKVHRNPSTGIDWKNPPRPIKETIDISIIKLAGLWGIWGVIGALYCVARWYWDGAYLFAMQVLGVAAIPMSCCPSLRSADRRMSIRATALALWPDSVGARRGRPGYAHDFFAHGR